MWVAFDRVKQESETVYYFFSFFIAKTVQAQNACLVACYFDWCSRAGDKNCVVFSLNRLVTRDRTPYSRIEWQKCFRVYEIAIGFAHCENDNQRALRIPASLPFETHVLPAVYFITLSFQVSFYITMGLDFSIISLAIRSLYHPYWVNLIHYSFVSFNRLDVWCSSSKQIAEFRANYI